MRTRSPSKTPGAAGRSAVDTVLELMIVVFVALAAMPARAQRDRASRGIKPAIAMVSPHRLGMAKPR